MSEGWNSFLLILLIVLGVAWGLVTSVGLFKAALWACVNL
jgi:hypothetical protein